MYQHTEKWEFHYLAPTSGGTRVEMICYPKSRTQIEANKQKCRELAHKGYEFLWCKKLYPASYEKHGHDLELVRNRTFNLMHSMDLGEIPFNEKEYARLEQLNSTATHLLELCTDPITWLLWEDWKQFKDLTFVAYNIRADACEKCGRHDLVQYC